jgi:hypothetical protein
MKTGYVFLGGLLMVVFCNPLVQPEPTVFKARILNCIDQSTWCSSSCRDDTSKTARLIDSARSIYEISTYMMKMSSRTTFIFTQDSFCRDYRTADSGSHGSQCRPYTIISGDTTEADSVQCLIFAGPWLPARPQREIGSWDCDDSFLYLHYRQVIMWDPGYGYVDTTLQLSYCFSENEDTLYIGEKGQYSGFTRQ